MTDQPATGHADAAGDAQGAPLDLDTATAQALLALPGRSPDPAVCPFLRAEADRPPTSDATEHRCVALAPFVALADRQRQLTCEQAAHRSCPRYTRGEAAVRVTLAPSIGKRSRVAPAAIGSAAVLLVLVAAVAASSGLAGPTAEVADDGPGATAAPSTPTGDPVAGVVPSDGSLTGPSGSSSASPGDADATLSSAPPVEPRPTVRPTLVATRGLPVAWRGLEACPDAAACYLYVVKRGDTFGGIASRFETTTRKLRRLNPGIADPGTIRVGNTVRVPPPPSS